MKGNKKNDLLEYVDKIVEKEYIVAYKKSKGTVILKNGFVFKISQMFNFFRDSWIAFNRATLEFDDEKRLELLKITNGGVITNGIVSVDLSDVSAMFAENGKCISLPGEETLNETPFDDDFCEGDSMDICSSN